MSQPSHYVIKNWKEFQHYKDRNPPWIKLHFAMLSSEDWTILDDASRVLAIACMLIGSKDDGRIPNNPKYMQRVAYLNSLPDFSPLLECGFLQVIENIEQGASNPLASASNCLQNVPDARPETETETEERREEKENTSFCPEPQAVSELEEVFALEFPMRPKKKGGPNVWGLTEGKLAEWEDTYGDGLDVYSELCRARQWLFDNPGKLKTQTGMTRFLGSWLERAQNRRGGRTSSYVGPVNRADPKWMAENDDYTAIGGTRAISEAEYDALARQYGWDKEGWDEE